MRLTDELKANPSRAGTEAEVAEATSAGPDPSPNTGRETSAAPPPGETEFAARYRRARARVQAVRAFYTHLMVYVVINLFLFGINVVSDSRSLWFYWPLMGWGMALAIHGLLTFGPLSTLNSGWEQRKIREYMDEDR